MQCEKHREQLERWWSGGMTETERSVLKAELASCPDCRRELETGMDIWDLMGEMPVPRPSDTMQLRFDAMLESYKATADDRMNWLPGLRVGIRNLFAIRPRFAMAYSLILLAAGIGLGFLFNHRAQSPQVAVVPGVVSPVTAGSQGVKRQAGTDGTSGTGGQQVAGNQQGAADRQVAEGQQGAEVKQVAGGQEGAGGQQVATSQHTAESQQLAALTTQVHEMREMMMLSLLQNPSASERMRGVSYTSDISKVNRKVAGALLETLNNDPDVNVRLSTLEALTQFANNPAVREGLVQSIAQQESPLVQAALADVMLKLQEKRSVSPFKKLLQDKDLNGMVRSKIEQTITRLI